MKTVSIIIPTMKGREKMLARLVSTLPDYFEVIVVGDDDLLLAAKRNKGARLAKGDYLLFIDDDNYLERGAVHQMVSDFEQSDGVMGMIACYSDKKMRVADGGSYRFYTSGLMWGVNTNKKLWKIPFYPYEVDEVANAFLIPKQVFEDVGGFDEKNFPIDMDEADICKRIKDAGYRILMNPKARCYHDSQTYSNIPDFRRPMNAYFMARNKVLFQKKHLSKLKLLIYFSIFFPVFILGYTMCLLYRGKPTMVLEYWKGSFDGIFGRLKNKYQ